MKIKSIYMPIIIVVIFTVGIMVSKQLGVWKTESSKVPKKIENGEFAGGYDPADIRGSYTLGDIENSFDIKAETIAKAFGVESKNPKGFQVKELEGIYSNSEVEIGTASVRKFVALYLGIPYESDESLTTKGIEILYEENKISEEEKQELLKSAVELAAEHSNNSVDNANNENSEEKIEPLINGNTTVQDVIGYGIELEKIEELVGVDIKDKSQTIRQICQDNSIPFSGVKNNLNEYIK